jgi:hypothetical protein
VAAATFVSWFGMEPLWPQSPAPLVASAACIAASVVLRLQARWGVYTSA